MRAFCNSALRKSPCLIEIQHFEGIDTTGEDVVGSAHVGCELIDFVETPVDHLTHEIGVTQVANLKVVSLSLAETREF